MMFSRTMDTDLEPLLESDLSQRLLMMDTLQITFYSMTFAFLGLCQIS